MAAIEKKRPKVVVVSNYQFRHNVTVRRPLGQFQTSFINPRRNPQIIVTGTPNAVNRADQFNLKNIIKQYPHDTLRIRSEIAKLNRKAAERNPNTISPDCYVQDLDIYGRGHSEASGGEKTKPEWILFGEDVQKLIEPLAEKLFGIGKYTLVSSTTTSSRVPPPPPTLAPEFVAELNGYQLLFLPSANGRVAQPMGLNNFGIITGSAAQEWGKPSQPCVWTIEGELKFLDGLGGICGRATAVNSVGLVVGAVEDKSRNTHAAMWSKDLTYFDFGNDDYSSEMTCINSTGFAGGFIYHHPSEKGQIHQRPAIWSWLDGSWDLLPFPPNRWGQINCINSNNECLVSIHDDRNNIKTGIYNIKNGTLNYISLFDYEHIRPLAFTDDATIIGNVTRDPKKIVKFYYDRTPEVIEFGENHHVVFANDVFIVGWCYVDGYQRPWLFTSGEKCKYLPHVKYHHTRPVAINESGVIVGVAQSDRCTYPIKWSAI